MAIDGILIGSRALAFYAEPNREVNDTDVILYREALSRLKEPLVITGIPGKYISGELEISLMGTRPWYELLEELSPGVVEVDGWKLRLPSLSALWGIKVGAMAHLPNIKKTRADVEYMAGLGGESQDPKIQKLITCIAEYAGKKR